MSAYWCAALRATAVSALTKASRHVRGASSSAQTVTNYNVHHILSPRHELCVGQNLRGFASSAEQRTYPPHFLLRMPQLSPLMEEGKLLQWKVSVGGEVECFDLICDVEAATLTEREEGALILEVESQEDGYVAKIMLEAGQAASIGEPVLVLAQEHGDIGAFQEYSQADAQRMQDSGIAAPLFWQAYVKGESSLDM